MLERAILATLLYYDCLNWPLTVFELWSRLIPTLSVRSINYKLQAKAYTLGDIVLTLEKSSYLKQHVARENGFWFLKEPRGMWLSRIQATKDSEEKLARVFSYRWVFVGTPFLLGAFVSGSVAGGWAGQASDIDMLVVARPKRIWTVRLFLTLFTNALGIRRKGARVANQFCLNHYITQDALRIPFESLYNAHTYINLIPVVNRQEVFEQFFERNEWLGQYFFNFLQVGSSKDYIHQFPTKKMREAIMRGVSVLIEFMLGDFLGDGFEYLAKKLQLYFIQKNPLTGKAGGRIRAQDFQLEFHPQSKEQAILHQYNKQLKKFGLNEFYPEQDSGLIRK